MPIKLWSDRVGAMITYCRKPYNHMLYSFTSIYWTMIVRSFQKSKEIKKEKRVLLGKEKRKSLTLVVVLKTQPLINTPSLPQKSSICQKKIQNKSPTSFVDGSIKMTRYPFNFIITLHYYVIITKLNKEGSSSFALITLSW